MEERVTRASMLVFVVLGSVLAPSPAAPADPSGSREFVVKAGVMESDGSPRDRLRETRTISADPRRRPGWCFLVDPPTDAPYEVYSITYLPRPPRRLTGDFEDEKPDRAVEGLKTATQRVDGIRPFCFDFHSGDPVGEYRVEVFIDGALTTTLRLQVVAPPATSGEDGREPS